MNAGSDPDAGRLLLLGESEANYGAYRLQTLAGGRIACTLSVGADPQSPALAHKGDLGIPNEDGLLVIDGGNRVLCAVADAHYGAAASHILLRRLDEILPEVPPTPAALQRALRMAALPEPDATLESASTLLVAVLCRDIGAGFGFSYGDSTCLVVAGGPPRRRLNRVNDVYVNPTLPGTLAPQNAAFFDFDLRPDSLLVLFTDGVDRCHYQHAETSLGPEQYAAVFRDVGANPEAYARGLTEWALRGLEGHPGGQDNVAMIVAAG